MKRNLHSMLVLACCLLLAAATAAAQDKGKGKAKGTAMTLTGCLKSGADSCTFMLTNVTGTAKGKMASEYELMPDAGVNLKAHVGHKIEVTGTRMSAGSAAKMEGKKSAKEEARRAHIMVTAVKHLSPTCP